MRKFASFKLFALLAISGVLLFTLYRYFFPAPPNVAIPADIMLGSQDRVLVIAPHSDDETLGAGGLIYKAKQNNIPVQVVLITNGDGFTFAAAQGAQRLRPAAQDYIRLAYQRQNETLAALRDLGVPSNDVTFLGYPDRGLSALWNTHWLATTPYFSPFTQSTRSPYSNSLTPGSPFSGQSVVSDLRHVFVEFQPTMVIYPHPNDVHVDHWATHNFVTYTMQELRSENVSFTNTAREYGYLVHRGDWPAPKGFYPTKELLPPATLLNTGTHWAKLPIGQSGALTKYKAILRYQTQVHLMQRYLVSFARDNDLFGTLSSKAVVLVPPDSALAQGDTTSWSEVQPIVTDPAGDTLARRIEAGADLRVLRVATDGTMLFMRLETQRPISTRVDYVIHLRPLGHAPSSAASELPRTANPFPSQKSSGIDLVLRPGRTSEMRGTVATNRSLTPIVAGTAIQINVALADLGHPQEIFFGAETISWGTIDQMAWTLVPIPIARPESHIPTSFLGGAP